MMKVFPGDLFRDGLAITVDERSTTLVISVGQMTKYMRQGHLHEMSTDWVIRAMDNRYWKKINVS